MTDRMEKWAGIVSLSLTMLVLLAAAPGAVAQQTQGQPPQSQQNQKPPVVPNGAGEAMPGPGSKPATAPAKTDPKEEEAYKAFYGMKPASDADLDRMIKAGETFLNNYPQSHYRSAVYSRLTNDYYQKREFDKMYDAGDKTLALNPNDLTVLTLIGWVIPHGASTQPGFAQKLLKAEEYEKRALQLLATVQRPAGMTEDQFLKTKNQALAQAHSGLGLAYFRQGQLADAVTALEKATQEDPEPDPTNFYALGIALENLERYDDAAKAFGRCGAISSGLQSQCKDLEEKAKKLAATQLQPPKP